MRYLTPIGTILLCLAGLQAAAPIPPSEVAALRDLIKPGAKEDRWATIEWRTNLWEARQEAAREGKPILLWEMDGHPLGCT